MNMLWAWLKGFGRFWYAFIVGDDWTIPAGVVAALAATYGVIRANVPAWWLLPLAAVTVVTCATVRANRAAAAEEPEPDAADRPLHGDAEGSESPSRPDRVREEAEALGPRPRS